MDDKPISADPKLDDGFTAEYPTMVYPPLDEAPPTSGEPDDVDPDPDADAEWVVQTTRGIRLAIPVALLIAVLLVGAGFWGGAALEKSHGGSSGAGSLASLASRFRAARAGAAGAGGTSGFGGFGGFGGSGSSAAATGTISVVDGKTLYVLTDTGSLVKVSLTPSTTLTRNADTAAGDLRPGDTVVVQGTTARNGNVSATSIAATAPGVSSSSGRLGGFGGGAGGLGGGAGGTSTTAAG